MSKKEVHIMVDDLGQMRVTWEPGTNVIEAIKMCELGISLIEKKLVEGGRVIVPKNNVVVPS